MRPQFSIVLPCYNEAENLYILLERFHPFSENKNFELILVNNGSTDQSSEIFSKILRDQRFDFLKVVNMNLNLQFLRCQMQWMLEIQVI